MTLKALADQINKALKTVPGNTKVYLQVDSEGNGYEEVQGIDTSCINIGSGRDIQPADVDQEAGYHCLEDDEWEELKSKNNRIAIVYP